MDVGGSQEVRSATARSHHIFTDDNGERHPTMRFLGRAVASWDCREGMEKSTDAAVLFFDREAEFDKDLMCFSW